MRTHKIFFLLILLALLVALPAQPAGAQAAAPLAQQDPTPVPAPGQGAAPARFSPLALAAFLLLLIPLGVKTWQARHSKAPEITSACCLPVVDENKRPFRPMDETDADGK